MIIILPLITKRYVGHGWVRVEERWRNIIELLNTMILIMTLILNVSLVILFATQFEGRLEAARPWWPAVTCAAIQAIVVLVVLIHTANYWTRGSPSIFLYLIL